MKICKIEGCGKNHSALGFCPMHYARFKKKNKVPLLDKQKVFKKGWHLDKDGYKHIIVDGKHKREHRVVMENKIGRKLTRSEVVHHINGIKTDNRIENLQIISFSKHTSMHQSTIPEEVKQKAVELYKSGVHCTKIPEILPIGYSCAYWFIRKNIGIMRGRHNKNKKM